MTCCFSWFIKKLKKEFIFINIQSIEKGASMTSRRIAIVAVFFVCLCFLSASAEFYPERIYKERTKTSLDYGWKFYQGTPAGTPSDSSYSDAAWQVVNVPHSASYDDPEQKVMSGGAGETNRYQGICWYRKTFTVPSKAKHTGRIMIEFEGAMQVANVWLNGKHLGAHSNSGYTWFQFDVSDKVSLTGKNVLAVQLDNTYNALVPPGRTLDASIGAPDYLLYSGLYRDVWLVCADSCSIPLWSQRISVPVATASATSAKVHIVTPVTSATTGTITVHYAIAYPATTPIAFADQTINLTSAGKAVFDTMITLTNPALWNYRNPKLHYLYTQVYKNGVLVDDYVERFGVRWYTWTATDGFALNGAYDTLRGASLHQSIGWIESALPKSRFFKEVGQVKEMGANLIRCAHFPRDPSFYNACDELGMLVMVEVPTWGCCLNGWTYPDTLFLRLDSCMKELIEVGYNHPSIVAWGLFNEPPSSYNAANQIPSLNAIAHEMDSTRYTYLADNTLNNPDLLNETDIEGMNYGELTGDCASMVKRILNTEYHEGWIYWCYRGGAAVGSGQKADDMSASGYAKQRWNDWTSLLSTSRINKLAGAVMWCFNDYWSEHSGGVNPMGVVDHMRIPKAVFYMFRKYWTGVKDSVPVAGLTPAKLRLDCDTNVLVADSTDVAIITASLRSAGDTCIDNTNLGSNTDTIPVTFTVTGPANYFGTGIGKMYGGKCALMVKTTNTPGTITVSATGDGFTATPITIQSVATDTTSLAFVSSGIIYRSKLVTGKNSIGFRQYKKYIKLSFADISAMTANVRILNLRGEAVPCRVSSSGKDVIVTTRGLVPGYYFMSIGGGTGVTKKFFVAPQ